MRGVNLLRCLVNVALASAVFISTRPDPLAILDIAGAAVILYAGNRTLSIVMASRNSERTRPRTG